MGKIIRFFNEEERIILELDKMMFLGKRKKIGMLLRKTDEKEC